MYLCFFRLPSILAEFVFSNPTARFLCLSNREPKIGLSERNPLTVEMSCNSALSTLRMEIASKLWLHEHARTQHHQQSSMLYSRKQLWPFSWVPNFRRQQINLDQFQELISIKTRQYAKRQATWARSRMTSWKKINPIKITDYIKKLKKSSLKLDQLT